MSLANKITLTRIGLLVPFTAVLISDAKTAPFWAIGLLAVAAISDYFDGSIARKRGEVSDIGKFLDPLADKLFVSAGLIIMAGMDELNVPAWTVIIIISREFLINTLRSYGASKGKVIAAAMVGKIKTTLQIIGLFVLLLLIAAVRNNFFNFLNTGMISYITALIVSGFTLYSGAVYVGKYIKVFKEETE